MANYTPEQMAEKIRSVAARADITAEPLHADANGTYAAPTGTAYTPVVVSVPETVLTPLTVSSNGTYTPAAGSGYSAVTVAVPVYDGTVEAVT